MSLSRFTRGTLRAAALVLIVVGLIAFKTAPDVNGQGKQPDFIPADYDDYQNMLTQLGIKTMRKGRDGKGKDTSDEATANPHKARCAPGPGA